MNARERQVAQLLAEGRDWPIGTPVMILLDPPAAVGAGAYGIVVADIGGGRLHVRMEAGPQKGMVFNLATYQVRRVEVRRIEPTTQVFPRNPNEGV